MYIEKGRWNNPYTGILAIFSGILLCQAEKSMFFKDGHESRDFIHVKDIVEAIRNDIFSAHKNKTYNLGSGKITSVLEMIEVLKCNFESDIIWESYWFI